MCAFSRHSDTGEHRSRKPPRRPRVTRDERLEARITAAQKELLAWAADMEGESLTVFVVRAAMRAARRRLRDDELLRLTSRDRNALVNALVAPPTPSRTLRKARREFKERFGR